MKYCCYFNSHILRVAFIVFLCAAGLFAQTDQEKKDRADSIARKAEARLNEETREAREDVLTKLTEARRLYQELGNKEKEGEVLGMTGYAYQGLGESRKALAVYSEALQIVPTEFERVVVLAFIASCYVDLREKEKALDALNRALEIADKLADRRRKAETLIKLGDAYTEFNDTDAALRSYDQAAAIYTETSRTSDLAYVNSYVGIALSRAGRLPEAFKRYETAYQMMVDLKDERGRGLVLNNRGEAHLNANSKQASIDDFSAALKIFENLTDKRLQVLALTNLGTVYAGIGEREKALESHQLAIKLSEALGDRRLEAFSQNNLGVLFASLGEHRAALAAFKLVERLRIDLGEHQGEEALFNNIGLMHYFLGENEKAAEYFNAALTVRGTTSQVLTYNNLGLLHYAAKDYAKAIEFSDLALKAHKQNTNRALYPTTLNNKALASYRLGRTTEAADLFDQAVVAYRSGNDRHGEAIALANMMFLWSDLNKLDLAIFYGKVSVNQLQGLRANIRSFEGEMQQSFLGTVENIYRQLIELLVRQDRVAEAEQVLRMLKDEEYFSFIGRDGAAVPGLDQRSELNPEEAAAAQQMEETARKAGSFGDEDMADVKAASLRRRAIFETRSSGSSDPDIRVGGSRSAVRDWKDPGTVMVSTIVAPNSLILIVTSAGSRRAFTVPVTEEVLGGKVGRFRKAITDAAETEPVSQELYDLLVGPIRSYLTALKAKTIVWSLDKFLRYLPIPALHDKSAGYMAQQYATVIMAQAGRQDLAISPKGKAQWRVLAAGVSQGSNELEALSFVPSELCSIVREPSQECEGRQGVIPGTRMLNAQFTYTSFTQAVPNYRVAHIATHFKFISGTKAEGLGSYLLLGNGDRLTMDKVRRSNGLFAGIELLTLSACDTAYGSKTADGREIEGFGVLAQKQGARSIIATLWSVDDESTRDLMVAFYKRLRQAGITKAEALRQAQMDMIGRSRIGNKKPVGRTEAGKFSHPYFWAPFILIGNWR